MLAGAVEHGGEFLSLANFRGDAQTFISLALLKSFHLQLRSRTSHTHSMRRRSNFECYPRNFLQPYVYYH